MYPSASPPSFRISHEGIRAGRHNGECHFRKAGGCPPCNAITPVPNIPYPGIVCKHNFPVPISIFHSSLNTDLQYRDISSEISVQNNYTTWFTAFIENGMVCINGVTPKGITGAISFLKINKKYTPRVASYGFVSFPASGCDINKINCVSIDTDGNIGAWIGVATDYPVAFVIQYPLKRN